MKTFMKLWERPCSIGRDGKPKQELYKWTCNGWFPVFERHASPSSYDLRQILSSTMPRLIDFLMNSILRIYTWSATPVNLAISRGEGGLQRLLAKVWATAIKLFPRFIFHELPNSMRNPGAHFNCRSRVIWNNWLPVRLIYYHPAQIRIELPNWRNA